MVKRIKALVLAAVLVLTLVAAQGQMFPTYAADTTTSASPAWTTEPVTQPATQPATKAPTTPTTPATPEAPAVSDFAIPTITRVLYFGTSGPDVASLQTYLTKVGYELEADGMFGNLTLSAVKKFQTKAGLSVDGYVGKITNAALFEAAGGTDVITTASLVNDIDAFKAGISTEGKWIVSVLKDLVSEEELVLDGTFLNGKKDKVTGEDVIQRKISLYTQDADKNVIDRFTLTAPKLTVNSPNARIQSGTFVGDVVVNAIDFKLVDATVEGNIYVTTQEAKDSLNIDAKSKVTGEVILMQPDVVTNASLVDTAEAFINGISEEGTWIVSTVRDIVIDEPLVLAGEFTYRDALNRKVALYSQDAERNVTRRFTLTAPSLTIESPNARIQGGIFKGDVYVNTPDFRLVDATVDGNVYFMTEEAKAGFNADAKSTITGEQILTELDAVVTPSLVRTEEELLKNIAADGTWIIYFGNDIKTDENLFLLGETSYNDTVQRKIAPYSQDDKRVVTRRFTLTAPTLVIKSPNTRFEKGDFYGDIYVSAPNFRLNVAKVYGDVYVTAAATGFKMDKTMVEGNIYYANQRVLDAAIIDADTTVSGVQEIQ